MVENLAWLGLMVGLIPYEIEQRQIGRGLRMTRYSAIFWSLQVTERSRRRAGKIDWSLQIHLIRRVKSIVWWTVMEWMESAE